MPALRAALPHILAASFALSSLGASCGSSAIGLMPGVINDPHNLSLRRSLLNYGLGQVCDEIRARSMPLRLGEQEPVAGRFFPTRCASRDIGGGVVTVEITGHGYVWTERSLRLGFEAAAAVNYDIDFLLDGSTMYLYFRAKGNSAPQFATRLVEQSQIALFNRVFGAANGISPTDMFGAQVMGWQLSRGFTIIRDESGGVEVGLGVVPPGTRPPGAYDGLDHRRPILANERLELHQNQRDFAGPFVVPPGKELGVLINVSGPPPLPGAGAAPVTPAVDILLVPRAWGDPWLASYTHERALTPPLGAPLVDDTVVAGAAYRRAIPVPPGSYYLVLDNTAAAGRTSPPTEPRDDRPLYVSYAVDLE